MGEKDKAFNDANTYKGMDADLSSSCHEQAAALILTKVLFWQVAMTICFP
jgi:hypothetical protein